MIQLESMLRGLDPVASESIKVIGYFDALTNAHVGLEGLLRGSATLTSVPSGVSGATSRGSIRVSAEGDAERAEPGASAPWPLRDVPGHPGAKVWIERIGDAHANDEMVLDRLAMAVAIALDRLENPSRHTALENLLSEHSAPEDRAESASRLRLDIGRPLRVVAVPASVPVAGPTATALTDAGLIRLTIAAERGDLALTSRAGIGTPVVPLCAPGSRSTALAALRISSPRNPVVDADEAGPLLQVAMMPWGSPESALFSSALSAESWGFDTIDVLVNSESIRQAAAQLQIHHSTLQARIAHLSANVGFDIRSTMGRVRLVIEFATHQYRFSRFS